jgi:putative ABC transport system permease protein
MFARLRSTWQALTRRTRWEQDLEAELREHIECRTEDLVRAGLRREEAARQARLELGGRDACRERCREANGLRWPDELRQDLLYAFRTFRRNRGFTAVAVLTLALGIGATTAIFTVVNAVLLRPLPYSHPEQLVHVQKLLPNYGVNPFAGNREFVAWRNDTQTLSTIAAYTYSQFNLTGDGEPERVNSGLATASFFSLLGVQPLLGRLFLPEEDRPGGPPVALLSETLWKSRYRGDPSIIGKGITLDSKTYTVVGVLPAKFIVPTQYPFAQALWVPLAEGVTGMGPFRIVEVVGRLKPGVSLATARSELDTITQQLQARVPARFRTSVVLTPWQEQITARARLSLLLFLGAVGFLLLIACVNVANLLLSRAATRQKEIAVRLTVGAGRRRIVRQLLTESVLLALVGGVLGLALARSGKDLLVKFISPNLPALGPIGLDYRVLGFCLALAIITGLAFGLAPALQVSRVSLSEVLKEAGRSASESRSGVLFRNLLLISETALALVLLVGAGLLFRSFLRVRGIDPGFKTERTLSLSIDLTLAKYPTPKDQARFFEKAIAAIKSLDGVQLVGGGGCLPLGGSTASISDLRIEGQPETIPITLYAKVSPDYFRAMGIPLHQGRYFDDSDRDGSPLVAVVNESFARPLCSAEGCLGKRVGSWIAKGEWMTIVGVVGDVRQRGPERAPDPQIYLPYLQAGEPYMTLRVRTAGKPMDWAAAIRGRLAGVDKDQPPHDFASLEELRAASFTPRRVNLLLLGAFAGLGLILACVGIFGVVSYSVNQRTHEIGVRMALGASRGELVRVVVGQGLRSVVIGTAVGVAASVALARFLGSMLFGVKPTDTITFVAVSLLLLAVAWLACYIPARRAANVDPTVALRYE